MSQRGQLGGTACGCALGVLAAWALAAVGCGRAPESPPTPDFDAFPDAFPDGGAFDLGVGNQDVFPGNAFAGTELPAGPNAGLVATGDFDGDGLTDVAVSVGGASGGRAAGISVFFQDQGGFGEPITLPAGEAEVKILEAGDVDGDGRDDLVWAGGDQEVALLSTGRTFGEPLALPRPSGAGAPRQGVLLHLDPGVPASVVFLVAGDGAGASTLYVVSGIALGTTPRLLVWPKVVPATKILNRPNARGIYAPATDLLFMSPEPPSTGVLWFAGDGAGGLRDLTSSPIGVGSPVGAIEFAYAAPSVILLGDVPLSSLVAGNLDGSEPCTLFVQGIPSAWKQSQPVLVGYLPDFTGFWGSMLWASATTTSMGTEGVTFFRMPMQYDFGYACNTSAWLDQLTGQVDLPGPVASLGVLNLDHAPAVVAVHGPAGARHTSIVKMQSGRLAGTKPAAVASEPEPDAGAPDARDPADGATLPDGASVVDGGMAFDSGGLVDPGSRPPELCELSSISTCETNTTIASVCPKGRFVAELVRCDGTPTTAPSDAYLQNHLCGCGGGRIGSCCEGVAFSGVVCCLE